jgi:vacuolar-type H+-ATPase subunit F/Vma7
MDQTKTFKIISHWGQETGFRLGGAQVTAVSNKEGLNSEIEQILKEKAVGILAIPRDMEDWLSEKNKKALKQSLFPLLARYTFPQKWSLATEAELFTEEMVFRAMGFHIRIKV